MTRCKACNSPNRQFIDQQLSIDTPARVVAEELAARGERFTLANLYAHKRKHLGEVAPPNPTLDRAMEILRQRVEAEMEAVPTSMLAAGWLVVLDQLEGLRNSKKSPESLIKALSMVNRIGGIKSDQQLLMTYMEKRWPGHSEEPPAHLRAVPNLD